MKACRYTLSILTLLTAVVVSGCGGRNRNAPSGPGPATSQFIKKSDDSYRVMVFIHGVFGDSRSTWKHSAAEKSWPEMIAADPTFNTFDVYSVGFNSPYLGRGSNIVEIAGRVRDQLIRDGVFDSYPEVYFVTHSMGGLISKRILADLNTPAQVDRLRRVKALALISTPSQGAPIATIANWISRNPQLRDMQPANVNTFIQNLEWNWTNVLQEREVLGERFPRVYCAYEKKAIGVVVVDQLYSTTRCDNQPHTIDQDHLGIVKPISQNDEIYAWTRARIMESIEITRSVSEMGKRYQEDSKNIGFIRGRLSRHKRNYGSFPNVLAEAEAAKEIQLLGAARLSYRRDPARGYILRFAARDRVLGNCDDWLFYGDSDQPESDKPSSDPNCAG